MLRVILYPKRYIIIKRSNSILYINKIYKKDIIRDPLYAILYRYVCVFYIFVCVCVTVVIAFFLFLSRKDIFSIPFRRVYTYRIHSYIIILYIYIYTHQVPFKGKKNVYAGSALGLGWRQWRRIRLTSC